MAKGFVYITGAGPGNKDYLTLKARHVLSICDCLIYDSLIDDQLLSFAPDDAEKIYVGKRQGQHSMKQEKINELLICKASEHQVIVRLKGGDPFVFGRGGEECLALQKAGIDYELIPGVTSAVAAAEMAGIPVTHRAVSRYFTVLTGYTKDGSITSQIDFNAFSKNEGTLVFLMGLTHLEDIVFELLKAQVDEETPVAVITSGATDHSHVVRSSLNNVVQDVLHDPLCVTPAIILVGKTAGMNLSSTILKPLSHVKCAVVGTEGFTDKLAEKLTRQGAAVTSLPIVKIVPINEAKLRDRLNHLADYTDLVFTSRNTIRLFFDCFYKEKHDLRELAHLKIAVIGQATADYLSSYHLYADLVPDPYTSAALGKRLVSLAGDHQFLIPRAKKGNDVLADCLRKHDCSFTEFPVYDTKIMNPVPLADDTDFIVFASSQGLKGYMDHGGVIPEQAKVLCIGEYTAAMAKKYHLKPLIAKKASADGLVQTILEETLCRDLED